jgi:hypothetical protein
MAGFVPPRERIFRAALLSALRGCPSMLDVGCGRWSPTATVGYRGFSIGLDVCWEDLHAAHRAGSHRAFVCARADQLRSLFRPRSVDAVVALDVVEHLEADAARALVAAMEDVARTRVVVFTPNGFVPQPPTAANPHQEHRSGFTVRDMQALGYSVRGVAGLKWLLGPYGECRLAPAALWRRVSDLTAPLVYLAPTLAFALFCVKDVRAGRSA